MFQELPISIDIEMIGDELTLSPIGTSYNDPGVIAYEGEEDVTSRVITTNPVDSNTLGTLHC